MTKRGRIISLIISICIFVAGIEVALRLLPQAVPLELLQHFHEELRLAVAVKRDLPNRTDISSIERDDGGPPFWKYRANESVSMDFGDEGATVTIVTDELGFCNPSTSAYSRNTIEILAIGDSLTWCTAVPSDKTWIEFTGIELGRSVYNLGYPGIGLYEYLVILRTFGLAKSPDMVIMNFTEGNDLRDALRYWRFKTSASADVEDTTVDHSSLTKIIGPHSYTYNLVLAIIQEWMFPHAVEVGPQNTVADSRLASIDRKSLNFRYTLDFGNVEVPFNIRNADKDELQHAIVVAEGLVSFDVFDDAFAEFAKLAEEYDFIPVITYSPSANTAYERYAIYEQPWVGAVLHTYSEQLRQAIAQKAAESGFYYLDLTEPLRAAIESQGDRKAETLLYYPGSVHFSIEGNRVIGDELAAFIKKIPQ